MHTARTRRHRPAVNRPLLARIPQSCPASLPTDLPLQPISIRLSLWPGADPGATRSASSRRANLKGHRLCHQMEHAVQTKRLPSAALGGLFIILAHRHRPTSCSASQSASQPPSRDAAFSTHRRREKAAARARGGSTMPGVAETAGERAPRWWFMADDGTVRTAGTVPSIHDPSSA
jgi:hypothetical protein